MAVFGRHGSRPFNLQEMRRLFLNKDGKPWFVSDAIIDRRPASGGEKR
jgi:hypothetical protein